MDKEYRNEHSVMYSKMTSTRFRAEKEMLFSNGDAPRNSSFREKYLIGSLRPFNEDKFALLLLYSSVVIVLGKIVYTYKQVFYDVFAIMRTVFSFDSEVFVKSKNGLVSLWLLVAPYNWLTVPLLAGLATSLLTWYIVYYSSKISAFKPPSPFYAKEKTETIKWYHLGYGLAIYFGIIVSVVTFFGWRILLG